MKLRGILWIFAFVSSIVLLSGCGDDSPTAASGVEAAFSENELATSASTTSATTRSSRSSSLVGPVRLRVAHLSTDAPAVDIWVNGNVVLSGVPFGAVSDYLDLDAGEYRIQVTPAGAAAPVVIDQTLPLEAGNVYTVAAVGFLSSGSLEPLVLFDDLSIGAGARIRFVHTSADTGPVDVAVAGGPVLFSNVSFQKASEYVEVPGGVYDLEVRPAGSRTVALSIPGVEVMDGTTYSVFAIGRSFNGTLRPLPVVDAP